ncbi:ferredoxin [Lapillicoccus sp.]|uniref:ferredoxin n=1 Tax=Lapillicoccus sp. TaxID=1909287 RepID=UPI00326707E1
MTTGEGFSAPAKPEVRIEVEIDQCVGGGQCVLAAPELFDQDETDGTVILLRQPEADEFEDAEQAERVCPGRALRVVDVSAT